MTSYSLDFWLPVLLVSTLVICVTIPLVQRRPGTIARVFTFIGGAVLIGMSSFVGYLATRVISPNSGVVACSGIFVALGALCIKDALSHSKKK